MDSLGEPYPHDIALIRGALILALIMLLVGMVFKLGIALGYREASDDMTWYRSRNSPDDRKQERKDAT